jgi:hypothetical protein
MIDAQPLKASAEHLRGLVDLVEKDCVLEGQM